MKTTDYSVIASTYDKDKKRHIKEPDTVLTQALDKRKSRPFYVLDLGCGTGNYLTYHTDYYKNEAIIWHGLDASEEMLDIASKKLAVVREKLVIARKKFPSGQKTIEKADLRLGDAHHLPYENESFDYITCNFAFHHFLNKYQILEEVARVVKQGGYIRIKNIDPFHAPGWWVFRYFPNTWCEDLKRCWKTELITYELENRGFTVKGRIEIFQKKTPLAEITETARLRDISELNIISDRDFSEGLKRMESDLTENPGAMIRSEFALMELAGEKKKQPDTYEGSKS